MLLLISFYGDPLFLGQLNSRNAVPSAPNQHIVAQANRIIPPMSAAQRLPTNISGPALQSVHSYCSFPNPSPAPRSTSHLRNPGSNTALAHQQVQIFHQPIPIQSIHQPQIPRVQTHPPGSLQFNSLAAINAPNVLSTQQH